MYGIAFFMFARSLYPCVICNTLQCLKGRRCAVGCTSDS